ncbi:MAG: YjdF family protein [Clostridia bacterium]|nr:YjdF family protein [Clostridia bacterium]
MMSITLTVFFDGQFWVGFFEQADGEGLKACRVVFGAEPKNQEIHDFILHNYHRLRFSPPAAGIKPQKIAANPKRRQRQIAKGQSKSISTKSQQTVKLAYEENKTQRKLQSRERRDAEEQRKFKIRTDKKKAKHRGH